MRAGYVLMAATAVWILGSCKLEDPTDGVEVSDVITLQVADPIIAADGQAQTVLTATLGDGAEANSTITFTVAQGSLLEAETATPTTYSAKASSKTLTAVLRSNIEPNQQVLVQAKVGDFVAVRTVEFAPAYPQTFYALASRGELPANALDSSVITANLFRTNLEETVSNGTVVEFEVDADTATGATAVIRPFAFSRDGIARASVRSADTTAGTIQVRVRYLDPVNGDSPYDTLSIRLTD